MGGRELEFVRASEKRSSDAARAAEATRERRCVHYPKGVDGEFYGGNIYISAVQRLKVSEAMKVARNVEPFFWSDAKVVRVWLCEDCASELGLQK
jgi:hypothetical protein